MAKPALLAVGQQLIPEAAGKLPVTHQLPLGVLPPLLHCCIHLLHPLLPHRLIIQRPSKE
jgi:hypothetical protein